MGALVVLAILASGCLQSSDPFLPFESAVPESLGDGWVVSAPEAEGFDADGLAAWYRALHEGQEPWQLRSLLIIRNGRLVAESYLKDPSDRARPRPLWSGTKQVVGVLAGIALEEGLLDSLGAPISDYLGDVTSRYPGMGAITIEQGLTMTSGIDFEDEGGDATELLANPGIDALDYILSRGTATAPGSAFHYDSGTPHLVVGSIQARLGRPVDEWADDVLFSRIGFTEYEWFRYAGVPFGGWGISTTPRHFARIAQLVLDRGSWNGEQIVDPDWIDAMLTPRQATGSDFSFGYLWWLTSAPDFYVMLGSGGQFAVVSQADNMVVVGMSEDDTDGDLELGGEVVLRLVQQIRTFIVTP